ncbi:MAG: thiamine pyrophosphate-dependent dehydrogenase E1 component subunit alpha [Deltaproteobacteria bacterium]|nr:thiamine pyrophosphate-dependent dehydrogenase E1 component subunit alpha [Deltaproteobacteria bacterium]
MVLSRRLEMRIVELYRQGVVTGGCYTGIGNEATSVGTALVLEGGDVLVPTHRDMGSHLVRGHTPLEIMRQYLKRATSQTGGRDTGLHLGREGSNIVGMISHLAHMMPVAVGVALAERMQDRRSVVLTTVGDGATSLGDFHESLNFAAVSKAPVVFVIVNNQYAYSTPTTLQFASKKLSDRATGYGMVGHTVDGTDVFEVLCATEEAVARARAGDGPTLLECVTMRMRGHSEHDDFKYVPAELIERWSAWDPVERLSAYLGEQGLLTPGARTQIEQAVAEEIEDAVHTAQAEPLPAPQSAVKDVFRRWDDRATVPDIETYEARRIRHG